MAAAHCTGLRAPRDGVRGVRARARPATVLRRVRTPAHRAGHARPVGSGRCNRCGRPRASSAAEVLGRLAHLPVAVLAGRRQRRVDVGTLERGERQHGPAAHRRLVARAPRGSRAGPPRRRWRRARPRPPRAPARRRGRRPARRARPRRRPRAAAARRSPTPPPPRSSRRRRRGRRGATAARRRAGRACLDRPPPHHQRPGRPAPSSRSPRRRGRPSRSSAPIAVARTDGIRVGERRPRAVDVAACARPPRPPAGARPRQPSSAGTSSGSKGLRRHAADVRACGAPLAGPSVRRTRER